MIVFQRPGLEERAGLVLLVISRRFGALSLSLDIWSVLPPDSF